MRRASVPWFLWAVGVDIQRQCVRVEIPRSIDERVRTIDIIKELGRRDIFYLPCCVVVQASTIGNPYLFTGREYDPETGLYYYRTRYLDPVAGRFTTRDVIGLWGDEAELGNGYSYVGNNPGSLLDPFGLSEAIPTYPLPGPGPRTEREVFEMIRALNLEMEEAKRSGAVARLKELNIERNIQLKRVGLTVGAFGIGALVKEVHGASETLVQIQQSGYYIPLLVAIRDGNWKLAYKLIDLIQRDVLLNARDRTAVDVYEWLMKLIEKQKLDFERKQREEEEKRAKERLPHQEETQPLPTRPIEPTPNTEPDGNRRSRPCPTAPMPGQPRG